MKRPMWLVVAAALLLAWVSWRAVRSARQDALEARTQAFQQDSAHANALAAARAREDTALRAVDQLVAVRLRQDATIGRLRAQAARSGPIPPESASVAAQAIGLDPVPGGFLADLQDVQRFREWEAQAMLVPHLDSALATSEALVVQWSAAYLAAKDQAALWEQRAAVASELMEDWRARAGCRIAFVRTTDRVCTALGFAAGVGLVVAVR